VFNKIITLPERFATGEPTLMAVAQRGHRGWLFEKNALAKTASPALDYIINVQPRDNKTVVLVNAMGAFEVYDDNRNGDGFNEEPYRVGEATRCGHPKCNPDRRGWINPDEILPLHYQSFEKFGKVYQNHLNKDPGRSLGSILKAFYNSRMHRVELLLELDNFKAKDHVQRINDGAYPAVSMGCFQKGTLIKMFDGTCKPIEDVTFGDLVQTHTGKTKKVTELHRREYTGIFHHILLGKSTTVSCTHEHPFFVVDRKQVQHKNKKGYWNWREDTEIQGKWLTAEELNSKKHFLLTPINRTVETPDYVSTAFARLLGYYLAKGSILRNKYNETVAVSFSVNETDAALKEIPELCKKLSLLAPRIYTHHKSNHAFVINVYDREFANQCVRLAGTGSKTKCLAPDVLLWHPAFQKHLFSTYANGDGCGTDTGMLCVSTSSFKLAHQWLSILPRFDVLGTVATLTHKATGFSDKITIAYQISIGKQYAQLLTGTCQKVQYVPVARHQYNKKIIGDFVVTPIRSIKTEYVSTPVFNFEVEEDNSYLAEGVAVHNCHVQWDVCAFCGHRAPTRKDYCEHLLMEMRQIDPATGVRKCALNPSPRLFDISIVVRPADETGYMLKKVAEEAYSLSSSELGEKIAAFEQKQAKVRKLSEIQKIIAGNIQAARPLPEYALLKKYREDVLPGSPETPPMGEEEKAAFLSFPLVDVLSSLAFKGAALSTAEFAELLLSKRASYDDDILDRLTAIQPLVNEVLTVRPDLIEKFSSHLLDSEHINPDLLSKCALWIEKRAGILDWARQKFHDQAPVPFGRGSLTGPAAAYSMHEPPRSDVFTMTDPNTGEVYRTNRAAMMAGEDTNYRSLLGDTALYGAAYTGLMHLLPGVRHIPFASKALLSLPLGYLTAQKARQILHPYSGTSYRTDQGLVTPANVEFVKTSTLLNKLAHDYTSRLGYWPAGRLDAALLYKIAKRDPSSELPEILFDEQRRREKVAAILRSCETMPTDATSPPDMDLSRLGSALGALALG
jgi:hypothetical protein